MPSSCRESERGDKPQIMPRSEQLLFFSLPLFFLPLSLSERKHMHAQIAIFVVFSFCSFFFLPLRRAKKKEKEKKKAGGSGARNKCSEATEKKTQSNVKSSEVWLAGGWGGGGETKEKGKNISSLSAGAQRKTQSRSHHVGFLRSRRVRPLTSLRRRCQSQD